MKKITILVLLLGLGISPLLAQKNKRDKIESLKVGFLSTQLNLSSEEAERFWPVYNKFNDEQLKLRRNAKLSILDELQEMNALSTSDAEKYLQELIQFKYNEAELIKRYSLEFKKVLPVQKVVMLFKAENDFKKELLRQLKDRNKK
jgi:hypothetical protein